jgi:hypothetical protein
MSSYTSLSLDIHMLIGTFFAILALSHVMAHVCNYERLVSADQEYLEAMFGDKLGGLIPTSKIGSFHDEAKSHYHLHYHGDLLSPSLFIDSVTTPEF